MVKGWCFLILAVLIMPFVISENKVNTQITIKTEGGDRIWLVIKDQSTMRTIGSFNTTIPSKGERILNFESTPRMLSFSVSVYEGDSLIKIKEFAGFMAGNPVTLDTTLEEEKEEIVEEKEEENEKATNETGNVALTGEAVSENKVYLKIIYYIVGGILVAFVISFIIYARIKKKPSSFTVTKLSDKLKETEPDEKTYSDDKDLREAEKKLEEMQREIERLKRIKDAERRLDEAKNELEKLRGG